MLGKEPKGKTVAMLGVTFKAETDDVRDSASIDIINELLAFGVTVKAYDPKGLHEAKKMFGDKIAYTSSAYDAVTDADCMLVATEWSEFKFLDFNRIGSLLKNKVILDLRNIYSLEEMKKQNFVYVSIGRPKINSFS
jgi:UDPglucose 6-dehydrogenase